jgi:hypothetical protein
MATTSARLFMRCRRVAASIVTVDGPALAVSLSAARRERSGLLIDDGRFDLASSGIAASDRLRATWRLPRPSAQMATGRFAESKRPLFTFACVVVSTL